MMGLLSSELAPVATRLTGPRVYADANVPAGAVAFMRRRLGWDVPSDVQHFRMARQLHRTLVTMDRDYLDDRRFPPAESAGVLVIWAPDERLLIRTLQSVDARLFRDAAAEALPLTGRKLVADQDWSGRPR
jgi:hypothetical protein